MRLTAPPAHAIDRLVLSKRILVLGSSGSGKTYLSIRLGEDLDIEPIHLDKYFWKPGWVPTPQGEWRKKVFELVDRSSWIIDGTYESTLDVRLPACETIIVVESDPITCTWGIVKRRLTIDDSCRPDAPPGQPIDRAFLRYIWRYPYVTRPLVYQKVQELAGEKNLVIVKGARGVNELLKQVSVRRERRIHK